MFLKVWPKDHLYQNDLGYFFESEILDPTQGTRGQGRGINIFNKTSSVDLQVQYSLRIYLLAFSCLLSTLLKSTLLFNNPLLYSQEFDPAGDSNASQEF